MSEVKATVPSNNWTLEYAIRHMDDPAIENRVKLAKFIGKVGKEKYDSTVSTVLQAMLDDDSIFVVSASLNSCEEILKSIVKNPKTYKDPSSCVGELKLILVQMMNRKKNLSIHLKILMILKDLAMREVEMKIGGLSEDLESTIDLQCLQKQVDDTINILIEILKSPSKNTVDRINCLGLLVYDLTKVEKYKTKVAGVLKKMMEDITQNPNSCIGISFKQYMTTILSHLLGGSSSQNNAKAAISELKKIQSPMYSIVLQFVPKLTKNMKSLPKNPKQRLSEFESLAAHLETADDLKKAIEFCRRENSFSLLFHCKPEKLDTLFKHTPGLRSKVIKYAKKEMQSHKTELRKCAILKNLALKFKK